MRGGFSTPAALLADRPPLSRTSARLNWSVRRLTFSHSLSMHPPRHAGAAPRRRLPLAPLATAALLLSPAGALSAQARPAPAPGTRVRLTLADTAFAFGDELFIRRPPPPLEGRLVRLDSGEVVVRLPGRGQFGFPSTSVRRLEARTGRGVCARTVPARVACAGAGALVGALVIGRLAAGGNESRTVGARVGAVLGAALSLAVGRDRWARVPGWPAR